MGVVSDDAMRFWDLLQNNPGGSVASQQMSSDLRSLAVDWGVLRPGRGAEVGSGRARGVPRALLIPRQHPSFLRASLSVEVKYASTKREASAAKCWNVQELNTAVERNRPLPQEHSPPATPLLHGFL